jgi:tetratricopeptide (TPR) repeat protein
MRRRLEKEPNARVFSQLADELRKEGDLAEAVRICREGVQRYAAYPTLRVTLGRLLLEKGDLAAARVELETALAAAPDNILAERSLGECLEALGDLSGARARYEAALALAPADAQLAARLRAIEEREEEAEPDAVIPVTPEDPLAALDFAAIPDEAAPASVDIELDLPPPPPEEPRPIPLVAVEEPFVIERAGDVGAWKPPPAAAPPPAKAGTAAPAARPAPAPARAAAPVPAATAAPPAAPSKAPVAAAAPAPPPAAPTPGARASAVAWPSGRLADHEFADLVSEVHARRWSGLLTLNHMGVEKSMRVQDGRLVFASSSSRDDRLGELLLRHGRITLHQYMAAGRAIAKGKRLGTILVEQGALDARELVKAVVEQTQEIIYSAFQWTEGLYHLTEAGPEAEAIMLRLSTPDVILEGIRRVDAWSRIEKGVGGVDARYARAPGYEQTLDQMTLSLEKLSLLTGLETEQDLGSICRQSTLSHFEVCRTMWAYRVIGVVRRAS